MVDVFISYPRRERERAERIKAKLETLKLDIFFDIEGIDGGAVFPRVISNALDASKAIVCCWSPLYFTRPWCVMEAREGLAREGQSARILPICLERFDRTAPDVEFRSLNYFDLTNWSGEDEHEDWNRTLLTLGKLVGRDLAGPLKKGLFGGVKATGPAPAAPEPAAARADIVADLRETWRGFPARDDEAAVERFLARVRAAAPGSGLEFEVEHHLDELKRVRAPQVAREAAEAEARRQAEEAARKAEEEDERRLGPVVVRARDAARAGRPVSERAFPIELPGVSDWPNPLMIAIPPGRFLMGAPASEEGSRDAERPQHEVRIDYAFALGQHTVTVDAFKAFVTETNHDTGKSAYVWNGKDWKDTAGKGWRDQGFAQTGAHPVCCVNWEDVQAYIAWLNKKAGLAGRPDAYRLPSEAEWEYACRAGTTTPFSFGGTISTAQANYDGNSTYGAGKKGEYRQKTLPVGFFPANSFGLHEMHGNVSEWVEDGYTGYGKTPRDGSANTTEGCSIRVFRGGSWFINPAFLRSAFRLWSSPTFRSYYLGFRVARTLLSGDY